MKKKDYKNSDLLDELEKINDTVIKWFLSKFGDKQNELRKLVDEVTQSIEKLAKHIEKNLEINHRPISLDDIFGE